MNPVGPSAETQVHGKPKPLTANVLRLRALGDVVKRVVGRWSDSTEDHFSAVSALAAASMVMAPAGEEKVKFDVTLKELESAFTVALTAVRQGNERVSSPEWVTRGCSEERASCVRAAGVIAGALAQIPGHAGMVEEATRCFAGWYETVSERLRDRHTAEEHWGALEGAAFLCARNLLLKHSAKATGSSAPEARLTVPSSLNAAQQELFRAYDGALTQAVAAWRSTTEGTTESIRLSHFGSFNYQQLLLLSEFRALTAALENPASDNAVSQAAQMLSAVPLTLVRTERLMRHVAEMEADSQFPQTEHQQQAVTALRHQIVSFCENLAQVSSNPGAYSLAADSRAGILSHLGELFEEVRGCAPRIQPLVTGFAMPPPALHE